VPSIQKFLSQQTKNYSDAVSHPTTLTCLQQALSCSQNSKLLQKVCQFESVEKRLPPPQKEIIQPPTQISSKLYMRCRRKKLKGHWVHCTMQFGNTLKE